MNAKTEIANPASGRALDTIKLILAVAILIAGIWLFHHYEGQWPAYMRVLQVAAAVAVAGFVASKTAIGRSLLAFSFKSRDELRKVVWPSRQETLQSTLVILVVVLVVSILLWVIDSLIGVLMRWLLG